MRIAAVIVNYRTPQLVLGCLEALATERNALPDLQVIVVDNGSADGSAEFLTAQLGKTPFSDWVIFLPLALNGGFAWGNNQAILHLLQGNNPPEAIYLLNPDTRIEQAALVTLIREMERRSDAGAIGSQLLHENGTLAGSAFRFPSVSREFARGLSIGAVARMLGIKPMLITYGQREPVDWVTGASVLLRSEALRGAGLFDTGFFLYFEEVELMYRLQRHGWKSYHCPESRVVHIAGASTGIIDGKLTGKKTLPDYVFQSRRRYFALTGGRVRALMADIAWLFGQGVLRIALNFVSLGAERINHDEVRALLRNGIGASVKDARPAITRQFDRVGDQPAWMLK